MAVSRYCWCYCAKMRNGNNIDQHGGCMSGSVLTFMVRFPISGSNLHVHSLVSHISCRSVSWCSLCLAKLMICPAEPVTADASTYCSCDLIAQNLSLGSCSRDQLRKHSFAQSLTSSRHSDVYTHTARLRVTHFANWECSGLAWG